MKLARVATLAAAMLVCAAVPGQGGTIVIGDFNDDTARGWLGTPATLVDTDGYQLPPAGLDLDIAQFRVTKRVSVSRAKSVRITLVVANGGTVNGSADATVEGMQNGGVVSNKIVSVDDPTGNGRTTWVFPDYVPAVSGDITWTVTIFDGDPDLDVATATTRAVG